jgi:SAM-dependent methyltransferase
MRLYKRPDLYSILRHPDPELIRQVKSLIGKYMRGPLRSVMDPACGPGDWLSVFAREGLRVAGNDLSEEMCKAARQNLIQFPAEIVQGDLADLSFTTSPFDVALEVSGVLSEFSVDQLIRHLTSTVSHLRPDGIYILSLTSFEKDLKLKLPCTTFVAGPYKSDAGTIRAVYEALSYDLENELLRIRRQIYIDDIKDKALLEDWYDLRIYTQQKLRQLVEGIPDAKLEAIIQSEITENPSPVEQREIPEAMLVIRRRRS